MEELADLLKSIFSDMAAGTHESGGSPAGLTQIQGTSGSRTPAVWFRLLLGYGGFALKVEFDAKVKEAAIRARIPASSARRI